MFISILLLARFMHDFIYFIWISDCGIISWNYRPILVSFTWLGYLRLESIKITASHYRFIGLRLTGQSSSLVCIHSGSWFERGFTFLEATKKVVNSQPPFLEDWRWFYESSCQTFFKFKSKFLRPKFSICWFTRWFSMPGHGAVIWLK